MSSTGESKRTVEMGISRKPGLSCAECRRSKLKCDRAFPCQACIRRGCAGICPDGTLSATKGNKVLAAHAQKLAEQVRSLTTRVRELEIALAENSNGGSSLLHLHDPRENSPTEIDALYEKGFQVVSESMGSLSIGSQGQANYHGESAATEYLKELLPLAEETWDAAEHPERLTLPYEILELMNAFPFGLKSAQHAKLLFAQFLPSRSRADYILDLYYKWVAWMYDPITRNELESDILDHLYHDPTYLDVERVHSHRLSALFVVLAAGITYDPSPDSKSVAKRYYALAKAALSLDPISKEVTCATIQSLLVMFRYHYNLDRSSNETRWLIIGVCSRVGLKIGLHRDSSGWGLDPEEQQRRRRLFWELYMNDTWTSIVNGRPPSVMIQHTDCQFPEDLEPLIKPNGETEMGWHTWKARYAASCLSISVQHIFITKKLPYTALLDLDKKIRMFPVPSHLQAPLNASDTGCSWSTDPGRAMQQYCLLCERESNLLYLHRSFFAQALREDASNPLRTRYAPSLMATYRSACRLISSLKSLYPNHPAFTETSWFFWSGVFSSCIVLGGLVAESPGCSLSQDALKEFEEALPFFQEGSRFCRPPNTLTILQTLLERAQHTYSAFLNGKGRQIGPTPSSGVSENPDVFEVLGGRPSVITHSTSNSNSPESTHNQSSPPRMDEPSMVSSGPPAGQIMDYYDGLALDTPPQELPPYSLPTNHGAVGVPDALAYPQSHLAYPVQYQGNPPAVALSNNGGRTAERYYPQHSVPPYYSPPPETPSFYQQPVAYNVHPQQRVQTYDYPGSTQTQDEIWRDFAREIGIDYN
ncbi:hypothetical protein E1B28_007522 [Marasmius oreades]|uniref:Zn(2)-C6 fungal-type domain-containing protein n=1 Tax=Marasmius oreades TaxID=181124 RepID=A0A9P7S3J1_9AGAR|nr:uncharacterized protein E1B28_007522 [Marasmius oreades]KAG7093883.1 hypothetical protein E1B28_007522 [Marasmius oreades]